MHVKHSLHTGIPRTAPQLDQLRPLPPPNSGLVSLRIRSLVQDGFGNYWTKNTETNPFNTYPGRKILDHCSQAWSKRVHVHDDNCHLHGAHKPAKRVRRAGGDIVARQLHVPGPEGGQRADLWETT